MTTRNVSRNEDSDDEFMSKRKKLTSGIEERIENLICRVGDKSINSSLESNIEGLATALETDMCSYKAHITKVICECIRDLPERVSVYSTLVGLINFKNYKAGGDVVDCAMKFLKVSIRGEEYEDACTFTYFLSDLVNCRVVMTSSIIDLYNTFIEAALEENSNRPRSDWLMYVVMSSLVYSAHELSIKKEADFDRLLKVIEKYINQRNKDVYIAFAVWCAPQQGSFEETITTRPYVAFEEIFREALQHTIPPLCIPSPLVPQPPQKSLSSTSSSSPSLATDSLYKEEFYPLPRMVFRLFDNSDLLDDMPRFPDSNSIESADILIRTTFRVKVPINYIIVEAILGEIFELPKERHLPLLYGALLIEICKQRSALLPQVGLNASRIDVFVQTLLYLASKTLSHSFSAITKYHKLLKDSVEGATKQETTQLQVALLSSLQYVWKNRPQMIEVIVDKLLKTQIISCSSVVAWVLSEPMVAHLNCFYISHILASTLDKMHTQLSKTLKELENLKKQSSTYKKPKRHLGVDDYNDDDDDRKNDDDDERNDDQDDDDLDLGRYNVKRTQFDDEIDAEEKKAQQLKQEIKIIHCHIIKNIVNVLSDHIHLCENDGLSHEVPMYKILKDRLQEYLYKYHEFTYQYTGYLSTSVFTGDVDPDILHIYNNFTNLLAPVSN
ncbi:hypothetical protein HELRODRAFT_192423 [Helobdella robusta]|uniref:Nuclear cap-binding protein subunit 1 n=1 Tax=Helobdella robusta TaxID=6412 RepID=T1FTY1_HELRO|nr:hypothetical protein HELRODRAFT_192423 [Helobdella robusta]ESO00809.1 hypothetical protein HELRODRAFT_192423 [Helobdella robusta]